VHGFQPDAARLENVSATPRPSRSDRIEQTEKADLDLREHPFSLDATDLACGEVGEDGLDLVEPPPIDLSGCEQERLR
jgi:hypothetical protein